MTETGGAGKAVSNLTPGSTPGPGPGFAEHPDHNIDLEQCPERQRAIFADVIIADSMHALVMREANYPPVIYFPRGDVNMNFLEPTDNASYCPFKGNASYWSVTSGAVGDQGGKNAAWSYQTPYDEMAALKGYVAFYADRVRVGP
jgi:uncharacterized protein (DUF427 family)